MNELWAGQVNRPWRDYGLAAILVALAVIVDRYVVDLFPLRLDDFSRRAIYQTLATLSGTLLGLTLTAISVLYNVLTAQSATLDKALDSRKKARTTNLFMSAVRGLLLGFLFFLAALILDSGKQGVASVQTVAFGALIFVVLRLGRVVYLLSKLLELATGVRS